MLPLLLIIPVLTITMLITTDHALRPLGRIAGQAGALSRAVTEGGPIEALPEAGLPAEIAEVVAAINTMLRNLQHAFSLQQQFAADAAHELRTPLAVLLLQVSRLPEGEARDAILQDLQALSGLVGQLLRFAQAEDVMARERRMVDVAEVARRVSEELATLAVTRGQMIGFEAPEAPVMVLGHDALIDVAIRNVLDNALRHSPTGASINVTVTPSGEVRIEDEGPGVADAQKKRIFERFWRASGPGGGKGGGAGIGLALVQRVTRLHGGGARVEDRPGGEARFVLAFGVQAAPRQPVSA
jgi:signal transduction histidine kinase